MSHLFKRIDTVFLEVSDMDESIKWYTDVLGFSLRWYQQEGGYAAINIGETPLTLVRSKEVTPSSHCPFNFYTSDIHKAHQELKSKGVQVEEIVDYGDVLSFNFKDLDGHTLGVCYFAE
ncbi:VOC family protein [Bacillus salitolerans]|uniref:VOC family protein n=1 Tax=Bacillus salitolerans TaxID=1437434 RepID=A0ABW4LXX6_9BACI